MKDLKLTGMIKHLLKEAEETNEKLNLQKLPKSANELRARIINSLAPENVEGIQGPEFEMIAKIFDMVLDAAKDPKNISALLNTTTNTMAQRLKPSGINISKNKDANFVGGNR